MKNENADLAQVFRALILHVKLTLHVSRFITGSERFLCLYCKYMDTETFLDGNLSCVRKVTSSQLFQ